MNRRDFISSLLLTGLGCSLGSAGWPGAARAQVPTNDRNVLLNLTLRGGPDFRHLIVPPYDSSVDSYGYAYWSHRWRSHLLSEGQEAWEQRWNDDYIHVEVDGERFGVFGQASWLHDQFQAGNVAVVNNVIGSTTRDHAQALLVYESGDRATTANELTRDGWGGRLTQAVGGSLVSMTGHVRLFCNGQHPTNPRWHNNDHVITARNTRDIALYEDPDLATSPSSRSSRAVLSRALRSYYAAVGEEIEQDSTYHPLIRHERAFREFGQMVDERLATVDLPESIAALYGDVSPLASASFGQQMRNVYDSFACSDIFDFRVGSLYYDNFDSHKNQLVDIEPSYEDMFGAGKGLDTLFSELERTMPDVLEHLVIVVGGEFGRQLADNGDSGTDHGRGMSMLLIGNPVQGGVYGDLFPESEIPRYSEPSADIAGETAIEALYATLCDWLEPGAAEAVFPSMTDSFVEDGVNLDELFEA